MEKDVVLSNYSTFRIGGKARYFIKVSDKEELEKAIEKSLELKIPFYVLGGGSNTLISDKGFNGLVIVFKKDKPDVSIEEKGDFGIIRVDASALLSFLVGRLENFTGLEWAMGIPGTLGGAINGNAGAFGESIGDCVESVEVLEVSKGVEKKEFKKKDCFFDYRTSVFKNNPRLIILSAKLKLKKGSKERIKERIKESLEKRRANPQGFSLGSVFKNHCGEFDKAVVKKYPRIKNFQEKKGFVPAGFLIEECGLRGMKIGDAEISSQHANFIINLGKAKSENVLKLMSLIKKEVKKKFLIDLEEEIQIFSP
jgi:UDP-N-acetylmuramate dehydrogenase